MYFSYIQCWKFNDDLVLENETQLRKFLDPSLVDEIFDELILNHATRVTNKA